MKLVGRVVRVESGEEFTDKQQRILIKVNNSWSGSLEVLNEDGLSLDDRVTVHIGAAEVTRAEAF